MTELESVWSGAVSILARWVPGLLPQQLFDAPRMTAFTHPQFLQKFPHWSPSSPRVTSRPARALLALPDSARAFLEETTALCECIFRHCRNDL